MSRFDRKAGRTFVVVAAALMTVLLLGLAPTSARAGVAAGTGPLNAVDPDAGTVEIRDQTFEVQRTTVLLDSDGKKIDMLELEKEQASWVIFRSKRGYPRRILDALQLIDEGADDVEDSP